MLTINAYLERKPTELQPPVCRIEKIIELPGKDFADLAAHPYKDRDFIAENHDLMRRDGDAYSCLLVLDQDGDDGILIESEGSDYVRYGAYVSHARGYVERELAQLADRALKEISPDPDSGSVVIYLDDIENLTGMEARDDSDVARMFYRMLRENPAVADIEAVEDCMVVTPAFTPKQRVAKTLQLRDILLLGGDLENVYLVHDSVDIGFIPASYTAMLTDRGRKDHAELLDAAIKEIRPGAYGPEIVLTGIVPNLLVIFDQAAAAHLEAKFQMGDPTM